MTTWVRFNRISYFLAQIVDILIFDQKYVFKLEGKFN